MFYVLTTVNAPLMLLVGSRRKTDDLGNVVFIEFSVLTIETIQDIRYNLKMLTSFHQNMIAIGENKKNSAKFLFRLRKTASSLFAGNSYR